MPTVTKNQYSEEQHPWNWYIPEGATKLFIGTFPTEVRNRRHDFFYSSATNRFWEIISVLTGSNNTQHKTDEVENRKRMLRKLKLGLTDMGRKVLRQQGSSNDHSLFPIEFMDILQILHEHTAIDTLILTGNSQGNCSLSWFGIFCSINSIDFDAKEVKNEKAGVLEINNRLIQVKATYSPSRLSRVKTDTITESYKSIILRDL